MQIDVQTNPNCEDSGQFVFNEISPRHALRAIRVNDGPREVLCDVTGVAEGGAFVPAYAVRVTDSGDGFAYLVFGGEWGIRLRPETQSSRLWDLADTLHQWGEPFKLYGSEDDLVYSHGEAVSPGNER